MPKRKKASEISPLETIQFRPGPLLGVQIVKFAELYDISRGEAAKRLTGAAVRFLDTAPIAESATAMMDDRPGLNFDTALECLQHDHAI